MRTLVFISDKDDMVIFTPSFATKVRAGVLGAFYYSAHGMFMSFIWAAIYYSVWFAVMGTPEGVAQSVGAAVFWRSAWQFFTFDEAYEQSLKKMGFTRRAWQGGSLDKEISARLARGHQWKFVSYDAKALVSPKTLRTF